MGFLADVGKSGGIGQLGQGFLSGALQVGQLQRQTEMDNLTKQKAQIELQQYEKDNKEYHIDAALSMYPETERPFIKELLTTAGKIRPDGIVIGKDMREVPKLFEAYPKVAIGRGTMEFETLAKENEKLSKKGDAESQQQMIANAERMTQIKKHIRELSGKEEADKSFTLKPEETRFDPSGKQVAYGGPKEDKVKESYYYIGPDQGEYQVNKLESGGYVHADTGTPYEGDFSELRKAGKEHDGVDPVTVRTFEAAHPDMVSKKGTPEYGAALQAFIKAGERPYSQFVGTTVDGKNGIVFDARSGGFSIKPLPGGGNLQPKVSPTIPTEQTTALQQVGTLKEALAQVTDLYDESYVGPIAGPAGKVADNWGVMPDSKRTEFRALNANLYNTIIYLRSGKQINEEEAKRLLDELPTMNISPTAYQAKLKKFTWELNSIERGKLRELKKAGYRNVGEPSATPSPSGPVKVWNPATKSFDTR